MTSSRAALVAALATGAVTERNRRYHKPTVIEMESERPED